MTFSSAIANVSDRILLGTVASIAASQLIVLQHGMRCRLSAHMCSQANANPAIDQYSRHKRVLSVLTSLAKCCMLQPCSSGCYLRVYQLLNPCANQPMR